MRELLIFVIVVFIVALFLYSKLLPYKDKLNDRNRKIFNFFDRVFTSLLNFLKQIFKPMQVGQGLAVEMGSIALLVLLLIILNFL